MLKLKNLIQNEFLTLSELRTLISVNPDTFTLTIIHNCQCIDLEYDQYGFTYDNIMEELLFKRSSIFNRIFNEKTNELIINACLFLDENQKEYYRLKYA